MMAYLSNRRRAQPIQASVSPLVRGIIADLPEVHEKQDNLLDRISQHAEWMKQQF